MCVYSTGTVVDFIRWTNSIQIPSRSFTKASRQPPMVPGRTTTSTPLSIQSLDRVLKVLDFEAEMVQFLAIHVCGPEPAALFVPVQFQELGRTRTAKGDRLTTGRRVAFKTVHNFHAENLRVEPQGALDISDPEPRINKAERHAAGSRERD